MRSHQLRRCNGPAALGYEPGSMAWWDAAIRINYREARLRLVLAREWSYRLQEHLSLPARSRSQRKLLILLEGVVSNLTQAQWWRELASSTRVARNTRIQQALGALS